MLTWLIALASVIFVSLVSFIGVITIPWSDEKLREYIPMMVSFAAGALFGDGFIHLLPEAFEELPATMVSGLTILGIMLFFALENFVSWRHCHIPTSEVHVHPLAAMNLIGDGLHNLIDGLIIGASYLVSLPIGVSTTIAVILHEVPQEIGDFGVLVYSGLSVRRAVLYNFASALIAVIGGVTSLLMGPVTEIYAAAMLPVAAGAFVYIAGSDLLPELTHECDAKNSVYHFLSMLCGIAIMFLLLAME